MLTHPAPTTDWMHKRDLPSVQRIEEANHAWEGWSERDFTVKLREKTVIGMVSKILDVVGAFVVYNLREKELFLLKFEVAPELKTTTVGQVLMEELKRKAEKYKKTLETTLWEGETVERLQFYAKNGFSSRLKKNFFLLQHNFTPDGIQFSWNSHENDTLELDFTKNEPRGEEK